MAIYINSSTVTDTFLNHCMCYSLLSTDTSLHQGNILLYFTFEIRIFFYLKPSDNLYFLLLLLLYETYSFEY